MWEKIKGWGWAVLGILIFVLSLVGVMARRENKPKPDAGAGVSEEVTRQEVEKQNTNATEIEEKQNSVVVAVTKPVDKPPSKDMQEAINRFNDV